MAYHNEIGKIGEKIALNFLINNGYEILEKNWRYKKLEVDIIARYNTQLHFIEVKTRSDNYFENPEDAVNKQKQRHLLSAANKYLLLNNLEDEVQFDVIAIVKKSAATKINHIKDAFGILG